MKKSIRFILVIMALFPVFSSAQESDLKPQTLCPVMGCRTDKNMHVDYQGQRVYFCCPGCKGIFLKDPVKYMKRFIDNGIVLESVQEFCPVMTGHSLPCFINKNIYTDYKREKIYFCSADCKKSFRRDPEKYLNSLTDETVQE